MNEGTPINKDDLENYMCDDCKYFAQHYDYELDEHMCNNGHPVEEWDEVCLQFKLG